MPPSDTVSKCVVDTLSQERQKQVWLVQRFTTQVGVKHRPPRLTDTLRLLPFSLP